MPISKVLSTYLGIRNRSDIKLSKMLRSTKYFPFLLQNFFFFLLNNLPSSILVNDGIQTFLPAANEIT